MAKYDKNRKTERNRALVEYWQAHPETSYTEIGQIFIQPNGKPLTKQRVFQIIQAFLNKNKED